MRIIICGYGRPIGGILTYCVNKFGSDNVGLYTHPDEDVFGEHAVSVAERLGVWRSTQDINESRLPFDPDVIASIYYRHIIKPHVIENVKEKIFNVHTSLLPRHRGRSPVPWAIIKNDQFTGVTYHYIDKGIDTGRIILQATTQIRDDETQTTLFERLNYLTVAYFGAALALVSMGFRGVQQHGATNYNRGGCPYDGEINADWPWGKIMRFIRAMTYPPLPYARFDDKEIKSEADYRTALYERSQRNYS